MKIRHSVASVWAKVPAIACKGLCQASCGPILMSGAEWGQLSQRGIPAPSPGCLECPLLADGQCTAYAVRPLICRLWGVVDKEGMRCPHGCAPDRWLTDEEGKGLLAEMDRAGGKLDMQNVKMMRTMLGLTAPGESIERRDA